MSSPATQLRDWALHLAERGWAVFPVVSGGKAPAVRHWERRATTSPGQVAGYWPAGSRFNIGVACGPSRLVVIDLDTAKSAGEPDGASVLAELARERGAVLPATYTVRTPSGGLHWYYRLPAGVRLGNTAGRLGSRVDTRAAGGFVVAAGSIRPDGAYELVDDTEPAELPAWIVQVLTEPRTPAAGSGAVGPVLPVVKPGAYALAAVAAETRRVRTAEVGKHNKIVNTAAFNLGQLIGAELLGYHTARAALTDAAAVLAASDCECTARQLSAVIASGLAAGTRAPRSRAAGRSGRGWVA